MVSIQQKKALSTLILELSQNMVKLFFLWIILWFVDSAIVASIFFAGSTLGILVFSWKLIAFWGFVTAVISVFVLKPVFSSGKYVWS